MQSCFNLSLFKGTRPKIAYFMVRLTTGCVCVCVGLTISIYENVDFFCAMGPHFKKYLSGALPAATNLLGGLQVLFKIAKLIFLSWSQSHPWKMHSRIISNIAHLHLVSPQLLFCRLFGYSQSKVFALRTPWGIQRWACNQIPDWWH